MRLVRKQIPEERVKTNQLYSLGSGGSYEELKRQPRKTGRQQSESWMSRYMVSKMVQGRIITAVLT